ncbi:ABC transporter substrate-binding protein [Litoribacillus peritrichatus]|uniref:Solute-binding protein family 3/N-terminal domain-containing protein n=1 Tax=Litoribacillus peritrichatus TaxID=718191 RepID=A0ABP7MJ43_9GAMM
MTFRYLKAMCLFCFLVLTFPAFALDTNTIIITGNADKPPKIWLENQQPKGILVDILQYAEQRMAGYNYQIHLLPWKRAYQASLTGQQGIVGISKTNERLSLFNYSVPLYYDEIILVTAKNNSFAFNKQEDLTGKRIGICRGCSFGEEYEKAKKFFTVVEDNDNNQRLRMLLKGRIDAAIINPGEHALNMIVDNDEFLSQHKDQFVVLEKRLDLDPNYLAFSKNVDNQAFIEAFNQVIKSGYKRGDIQRIIERY